MSTFRCRSFSDPTAYITTTTTTTGTPAASESTLPTPTSPYRPVRYFPAAMPLYADPEEDLLPTPADSACTMTPCPTTPVSGRPTFPSPTATAPITRRPTYPHSSSPSASPTAPWTLDRAAAPSRGAGTGRCWLKLDTLARLPQRRGSVVRTGCGDVEEEGRREREFDEMLATGRTLKVILTPPLVR
ncbi:hypothetical protein HDU96_006156 [Phlyctochytrium bullatum]|nr:hypothetical protein HDU96_006156 [Phlyctochytrium bullatum]